MDSRKNLAGITFAIAALFILSSCDVLSPRDTSSLKASGVVEIMEVSISAKIGGQGIQCLCRRRIIRRCGRSTLQH